MRDARYFFQTSYRIDYEPFWNYFNAMGAVDTFGYPISRTFQFLGCQTQFYQRQLMQQCGTNAVQTMNLLDPDLMPYNQINFSNFPSHDPAIAGSAPGPDTPGYGSAVLSHVQRVAPDVLQSASVNFFRTFVSTVPGTNMVTDPNFAALVNLQIWGFPTSGPMPDPNNRSFIYRTGTYGDPPMVIQDGVAHLANPDGTPTQTISGSVGDIASHLRLVRNLPGLALTTDDLFTMASTVPANILNDQTRGRIHPGACADLGIWDESLLQPVATLIGGKVAWSRAT